jgi:hypothetical protein
MRTRTTTKLAAFALALGVAFGAGAAIGSAAGPIDVDGEDEHVVEHAPSTTTEPAGSPFSHDHPGGGH